MAASLPFFLIQVLNGVQYGLLLFLVASGLTLIFGIMGIINLAHGSFYMVGAYLAFYFAQGIGNLWLAILVAVPLTVALGMLLELLLFRFLYTRDHLYQVLLTYGLILVFEELRSILFGDDVHGVAVPAVLNWSIPLTDDLSYPAYRLAISVVCLALAGLMYLLIQRTRLGMIIRAGAINREMVQSLGIDIGLVFRLVFAVGVTLAAFAGMIAAPVASVFPGMGNQILIVSFVVVVIGGIGSIKGAFLGALLIGLADTFGQVLAPQIAGMSVYILMAAVLLWRPAGLFGRAMSAQGVATDAVPAVLDAPLVLEGRGIHTFYGASHVLHGVDFAVARGEAIGLMGRNGMGKTTLLRSLLGLTAPREGTVLVHGVPMTGAKPHKVARQGLAFVPEGRGMFHSLSVREHLVMAARAGRDGRRDWTFERVLETFPRLAERIDHGGMQLSGGEQQMVTIGRALMTNPDLLILDEATEGLAPLIAKEIWAIVRLIRASGIATIIVDKNFAAVSAIIDRCVVLVKGRVAFDGTPADLQAQPDMLHRHLGV